MSVDESPLRIWTREFSPKDESVETEEHDESSHQVCETFKISTAPVTSRSVHSRVDSAICLTEPETVGQSKRGSSSEDSTTTLLHDSFWASEPASGRGSAEEHREPSSLCSELLPCTTQLNSGPLDAYRSPPQTDIKKKRIVDGPVMKEVDRALPGALHQARKLLHILAKEIGGPDLNRFPREHHICLQVHLLALELSRAIKHQTMLYTHVRESFENLYYLMEHCKLTNQRDAAVVARLTRKIILIMERVTSTLEDYSGVNSTNWVKVAEMFLAEARSLNQDAYPYRAAKFKYFSINRLLGAGGFGSIYKAHLGGIICAVKLVPCALLTEVKHACMDKLVASMINHPFLVKYFACFSTRQAFVTAMEYIRGCDLAKVLKVARSLPEDVLRLVVSQLGEALQHMHASGFIHRDVKPANLLITVGCRIKLIDFDTAKSCIGKFVRKEQDCYNCRTPMEFFDSQIAGTVPYLAPECVTYIGYGRAMDWWATGVTTFHLATGRLPFQRFRTQEELHRLIAAGYYRWPRDKLISAPLQEFVNALMQKKPSERLCSHHYSEFRQHPFISGISPDWLYSTEMLKDFPPVKRCMGKTMSGYSPIGSGAAEARRLNVSPYSITDTNDQHNLYTYCSIGFMKAVNELNCGRTPTSQLLSDPQEAAEDVEPDYIFEPYLVF